MVVGRVSEGSAKLIEHGPQRLWYDSMRHRGQSSPVARAKCEAPTGYLGGSPSGGPAQVAASLQKDAYISVERVEMGFMAVDLPLNNEPYELVSQCEQLVGRRQITVDGTKDTNLQKKPTH